MTGSYKDSPEDFEVVDVPGDGNCFYYALSKTLPQAKEFRYRWTEGKVEEFKKTLLRDMDKLLENIDNNVLSTSEVQAFLRRHLQTKGDYAQEPAVALAAWQLDRCIVVFHRSSKPGQHWSVQAYGPTGKNCTRYEKNWKECKKCSFLLYRGEGKSKAYSEGTGHYLALKPLWPSRETTHSPFLKAGDAETKPHEKERAPRSSLFTKSSRRSSSSEPPIGPKLLDLAQRILLLAEHYLSAEDVPEGVREYNEIEKKMKSLLKKAGLP